MVGGLVALILDNILPGTAKERGILEWNKVATGDTNQTTASIHVYDLPFGFASRWKFAKYLPFLPYYGCSDEHSEQLRQVDTVLHNPVDDDTPQHFSSAAHSHKQTYI